MSAFKGLGSKIKNMWLTCEKIRLTRGFFSFSSSFLSLNFFFWFSLLFCALERAENALFLPTNLWRSTKLVMSIFKLIKLTSLPNKFSPLVVHIALLLQTQRKKIILNRKMHSLNLSLIPSFSSKFLLNHLISIFHNNFN